MVSSNFWLWIIYIEFNRDTFVFLKENWGHLTLIVAKQHLSSLSAGWSIACPIRMSLYIFLLYYIYHLCFTCIDFYDLSGWGGGLFVVYIRRLIYKFLNVCHFDYTAVAGSGKVGPVNQVNHTNRMDAVCYHLIDRPQSVQQRSYNRTLQFSKTFKIKQEYYFFFLLSSNPVLPLENLSNVLNAIFIQF